MEDEDARQVAQRQPSIMRGLSPEGRLNLVATTATFCESNPRRSVRSVALEVYGGVRALWRQAQPSR